jgi:myo-inositol 2-dehydrogenase/D-chiro-inositol 1-dehydrogenase
VDAVAICSPTDTRADLIEQAARAKKAIFCEKPIDLEVNRTRACLKVRQSNATPLMIGFNRRFDPNFASLRKRIAEGAIGALEIVSITSRDPSPPSVSYIARSGGLFRDMMIHDFDMARFILGEEPVAVSAMGSALSDKAIGEAGYRHRRRHPGDEIGQGRPDLQLAPCHLRIRPARGGARRERHGPRRQRAGNNSGGFASDKALNFFLERYEAAYRNELGVFVKSIRNGATPRPDGEDGLRANVLADAAYQSWATKQRVAIG